MKKLLEYLNKFLAGWSKESVIERPKTFWKYFLYYPLNWSWTLGSILFIVLFLHGWKKYNAPIFNVLALIPLLMMIYNLFDEYNAFLYRKNGVLNVSATRLMYIFYGACALILFTVIAIVIF